MTREEIEAEIICSKLASNNYITFIGFIRDIRNDYSDRLSPTLYRMFLNGSKDIFYYVGRGSWSHASRWDFDKVYAQFLDSNFAIEDLKNIDPKTIPVSSVYRTDEAKLVILKRFVTHADYAEYCTSRGYSFNE